MKFTFLCHFIGTLMQILFVNCTEESDKIHFTNSWAVHIENSSVDVANQLAEKHDFINFGQIGTLPGYYHFVHKKKDGHRRERREVDKRITLLSEKKIKWVEQQQLLEREKRSIVPDYIQVIHPMGYTIQDPLFNDQWYLNNIGQSSGPPGLDINVLPVWARGISGKGVVIAILDDGLDHTHPDLKKNYDEKASYDFNDYDVDPMPRESDASNCHGTKCAGEVAAEAGNGICGVGVAFNSSIGDFSKFHEEVNYLKDVLEKNSFPTNLVGIRMLDGNTTDTIEGSALSFKKEYIDIYSCAWGPKDDGKRFGRPGTLASKALELGVKEGRNGLGSIFVWATGNGGLTDDDCNCDGYTTSVYTVSIGAISDHGLSTYYTESCASTLAVTYSGGSHREKKENKIITTTLNHECTDEFKGTSSAAPLAAGMIALILEANRNLTWRDVQHIIVETSLMTSPLDEGWRRNGAGKWFNQKFGFGRMDAAAMVEKATSWNNVADPRICWSDKSSGPWPIPSSGTVLVAMNASSCADTLSEIKTVEHVQVVLSLKHRNRGHLSIELISPAGTRTQLLKTRRNDKSNKGLKDWVFMSVHFWGEDPKGIWTLSVTDNSNNGREHHRDKSKFGDLEDATEALQDDIETKDDDKDSEHENIVDSQQPFKSSEEFQNNIFKNDKYRKKNKKQPESNSESNGKMQQKEKSFHPGIKSSKAKSEAAPPKHTQKMSKKLSKSNSSPEKVTPPDEDEEEEKEEERLVEELLLETKPTASPFGNMPPEYNPQQYRYNPNLYAGQNTLSMPGGPVMGWSSNSYKANSNVNVSQAYPAQSKISAVGTSANSTLQNHSHPNESGNPHLNSTYTNEENTMLESVLKTVLTEAFSNFRAESSDFRNFEERLKSLEAVLHKNKTSDETVASSLIKAFKQGKAIDKINNVLGVLENTKNQSKLSNSSFYKNSEVVSDVLKVLKDILTTNKGDNKLNKYKARISKLLETSSNSTRQLTEKLFNDLDPKADGKEISSSVITDALKLISHIFQRKKKSEKLKSSKIKETAHLVELPKDVSILLKGPKGKVLLPYSSIENMISTDTKEIPSVLANKETSLNTDTPSNVQTFTLEHSSAIQQSPATENNAHQNASDKPVHQRPNDTALQKGEKLKLQEQSNANSHDSNSDKRNNSENNHLLDSSRQKESQKYTAAKQQHSENENHNGSHDSHYLSKDEDEKYENVVGKEEYYHQREHSVNDDNLNRQGKETEEGNGGYTIAVMKNGKKIGEHRVNTEQASRYLDQHREEETDRIMTHYSGNEDSRIRVKPPGSDVDVEVTIDKKTDDNRPVNEKPESPSVVKNRVGFDVTKYGNEETDDTEPPHVVTTPQSDETVKSQSENEPSPGPMFDEKSSEHSKKFQIRVDNDLVPKSVSYDLGEKKTYSKKTKHVKYGHKRPVKSQKDYYYDGDDDDEYGYNDAVPFIQIADPSQLAQLPPPAIEHENDNFIQNLYGPVSPIIPDIENLPQAEEHASLTSNQNTVDSQTVDPQTKSNSIVKRSNVNELYDYMQNIAEGKIPDFSEVSLDSDENRVRRSLDEDGDINDVSLLREKRDKIVGDIGRYNRPHVVKKSVILDEINLLKEPVKNDIKDKTSIDNMFRQLYSVRGDKRSAINKAVKLEDALKRKLLNINRGSSSVLSIIKRVHDDISAGNSKDLRKLGKDLAKLEAQGFIKTKPRNKGTAQSAVRTKVSHRPKTIEIKEDPDEYYKYGVDSSGELENWTLRFYGTGP